jgi:alpha-amylase/alpha-mannosidase (GH57 family)
MVGKLMVNIYGICISLFIGIRNRGFDFPWVRLHATKDYLFMAKLVEKFPNARVLLILLLASFGNFNFT